MKKVLLALALAALLLCGCAAQKPADNGIPVKPLPQPPVSPPAQEKKEFRFGDELKAMKGGTYANAETGAALAVVGFSDSRCRAGVQCVWQGEQGIKIRATDANGSEEVFLGEVTKKKANFLQRYTLELVSIDVNSPSAVVKASKRQGGGKLWFYYDPKQCGRNEWEVELQILKEKGYILTEGSGEETLIKEWLKSKGIEVNGFASKKVYEVVCAACSCPRGDRVAALVDEKDSAKIGALGWQGFNGDGLVFCTEDAKLCADGSAVGRQAPFCEFPECAKRSFYVKKVDVPAFTTEQKFVTTIIDSNLSVIVETKDAAGKAAIINRVATEGQLRELGSLIDSTNFFSLGPADMKTCIADAASVDLTVISGEKSNTLFGIGAWCDPNKLKGIDKAIEKIDQIAGG